MRLGIYGPAAGEGAPGEPWSTFAASVGARPGRTGRSRRGRARCEAGAAVALGRRAGVWGAGRGRQATALRALVAFARAGGPVLAVGAGFRSLCALGLLPGRVTSPADADAGAGEPPPPALAHLRVEGRSTPFTSAIPAGRVISPGRIVSGSGAGPALRRRRAGGARGARAGDLPLLRRRRRHARARRTRPSPACAARRATSSVCSPARRRSRATARSSSASLRLHLAGKR